MDRNTRVLILAAWCIAAGTLSASVQGAVPAEFQGTWVPAKSGCDSPVRVSVAADRLTLASANDSQALGGLQMAGPSFFGPDYRGIMAVLITEFSGHQPVTATFNFGEKKGAAQLEFAPLLRGNANAQMKAYNAHISKLNLAKRFPLDKVALKMCAGVGAPKR